MTDPFGAIYAGAYDALYESKDYVGEVDIIEAAIKSDGRANSDDVLDLGCGTGRHAVILATRGYAVAGVDRSPAMLERARERAIEAGLSKPEFSLGDVRSVDVGRPFDVVLLMFAVLGYQLTDDDVAATLANARRHLRPAGLLLFDVWYGPAVEAEGPTDRTKVVHSGDTVIERRASGTLDRESQLCTVRYDLSVSGQRTTHDDEVHTVRYFYEPELRERLDRAGFDLVRLSAFPEVDRPADSSTWNAFVVAKARQSSGEDRGPV